MNQSSYSLRHVLREIIANIAMGVPWIRARRVKHGRTTSTDLQAQAKLICDQFVFFQSTLGAKLQGANILEVGPGDAAPHALLLLGAGAARYVALDRFLVDTTAPGALEIYEAVLARARAIGLTLPKLDPAVSDRESIAAWFRGTDDIRILPLAAEGNLADAVSGLDIVLSFNVLEHLLDIPLAAANLAKVLKPDGVMLHRIDYGPHDVWRSYSNPLTFLIVPNWLWRLMGSNRGYPNRARHADLLEALERNDFKIHQRVTHSASDAEVTELGAALKKKYPGREPRQIAVLSAEVYCTRGLQPVLESSFESIHSPS